MWGKISKTDRNFHKIMLHTPRTHEFLKINQTSMAILEILQGNRPLWCKAGMQRLFLWLKLGILQLPRGRSLSKHPNRGCQRPPLKVIRVTLQMLKVQHQIKESIQWVRQKKMKSSKMSRPQSNNQTIIVHFTKIARKLWLIETIDYKWCISFSRRKTSSSDT